MITGDGLQRLSNYLSKYYKEHTPTERFSEAKLNKLINKPLKSQAVIAICMKNDPTIAIPEWEELAAVSCAVQNMWLSCTALGIGSYWGTPKSALEADDFLNLEENEKCLGWFFMGYHEHKIEGKRRPIDEKIKWISLTWILYLLFAGYLSLRK